MEILPATEWPYIMALSRLLLALAVGAFIGLEREQRGHPAGLRTFALTAVLGCIGGLEGHPYGLASLGLVALLVTFLNLQALREQEHGKELTTSVALILTGFLGLLCGQGHTLTPVAIAVVTTALLAWKGTLKDFSSALTEEELRSAILLAMLAFVIYPALPEGGFGPGKAIVPREAWLTVILIAGIGFVNYVLLKSYGSRGADLASFLGGLVNSTVTVNEHTMRVKESGTNLIKVATRGIVIANSAMLLRNAVVLGVLAPETLSKAGLPYLAMGFCLMAFTLTKNDERKESVSSKGGVPLTSPFSLESALKFGAILLILQLASVAAQQMLGELGVYGTAFLGGLISSASAVGAVGGLAAHGDMSAVVAARSAVIASIASIVVTIPLLYRTRQPELVRRLSTAVVGSAIIGILCSLI